MVVTTIASKPVLPVRVARAREVEAIAPQVAAATEAAEIRRWLLALGTPFVLMAVLFSGAIGTGSYWLLGFATGCPFVMIAAFAYLGLSSDTNTTQ